MLHTPFVFIPVKAENRLQSPACICLYLVAAAFWIPPHQIYNILHHVLVIVNSGNMTCKNGQKHFIIKNLQCITCCVTIFKSKFHIVFGVFLFVLNCSYSHRAFREILLLKSINYGYKQEQRKRKCMQEQKCRY